MVTCFAQRALKNFKKVQIEESGNDQNSESSSLRFFSEVHLIIFFLISTIIKSSTKI